MRSRRDRNNRPSAVSRRPLRGFTDAGRSDFTGAVDAVLSAVRRDESLLPDLSTPQAMGDVFVGLVDLAVSLAGHAVGPDIEAIERLLVGIRDTDETVGLTSDGGA